jgi:hypothetical protein
VGTKPFSRLGEAPLKHADDLIVGASDNGCDHVEHSQRNLQPVLASRPSRHQPRGEAMIETVTALAAFFSIGMFLAHAFDVWRTS